MHPPRPPSGRRLSWSARWTPRPSASSALSLHDALPIFGGTPEKPAAITDKEANQILRRVEEGVDKPRPKVLRSEEHTSELQSRVELVCRLLLEKKKHNTTRFT